MRAKKALCQDVKPSDTFDYNNLKKISQEQHGDDYRDQYFENLL